MRLRIDIAYNGQDLCGWARQAGQDSVQERIETALTLIYRDSVSLTVAGRTDAGVHASGQVAHLDVDSQRWKTAIGRANDLDAVVRRINKILAQISIDKKGEIASQLSRRGETSPVIIRSITPVPDAFDARFSALHRTYTYLIADTPSVAQPWRHDIWFAPFNLDDQAMFEAASVMLGEHDFLSFCKPREGATTVRTLQLLEVIRRGDGLIAITVQADAFCHSMVRSIVGALSEIGRGRRDTKWLQRLVDQPGRSSEVPIAPACGLTLQYVAYPDANEYAAQAGRTRVMRVLSRGEDCGCE